MEIERRDSRDRRLRSPVARTCPLRYVRQRTYVRRRISAVLHGHRVRKYLRSLGRESAFEERQVGVSVREMFFERRTLHGGRQTSQKYITTTIIILYFI